MQSDIYFKTILTLFDLFELVNCSSMYVECVCVHTAHTQYMRVCTVHGEVCVFGNGPSLVCKWLWETLKLSFSKQLFKLRII